MDSVVILTGAGISAESGLQTFRDSDGLWENERIQDVATPEGFSEDPQKVHKFYNQRRIAIAQARPNKAHEALALLERTVPVALITQNIDDLHERAGSTHVLHMHGSIFQAFCIYCNATMHIEGNMDVHTPCPSCTKTASMRPDIVWFGEMPYYMEEIETHLRKCSTFVAIGTSGTVYPAAGFVGIAKMSGARTIILNKEPIDNNNAFDEEYFGNASEIVPAWVEKELSRRS